MAWTMWAHTSCNAHITGVSAVLRTAGLPDVAIDPFDVNKKNPAFIHEKVNMYLGGGVLSSPSNIIILQTFLWLYDELCATQD